MVSRVSLFRRAFVAASVAWAIALPLAAFVVSPGHERPGLSAVALAVYLVGSGICHQIAARSFAPWGHQMPVCARCTGIYVGAAVAAVIASVGADLGRPAGGASSAPTRATSARVLLLMAALPTIATLVLEWTTGIAPSNAVRFATGLPLGAAVTWAIVSVLENQVN